MKPPLILTFSILTAIVIAFALEFSAQTKNRNGKMLKMFAEVEEIKSEHRKIIESYFDAGVRIGWSAARRGATTNDVEFIVRCMRENNATAMQQWFNDHP